MDKKVSQIAQKLPVPIRFIIESRKSARISLGKNQITLRVPKNLPTAEKNKTVVELLEWAQATIEKKGLYQAVGEEIFSDGTSFTILGEKYTLKVKLIQGNRSFLHIKPDSKEFAVSIPIHISNDTEQKNDIIKKLMAKGINQYFLPDIRDRVSALNREHFNAKIGQVKLRYTHSRWGSCSSSGNISLSTRLLLTPKKVIDYVIIHELAHRFEMNHSENFWALVNKAEPNYKKYVQWLKRESNNLIL